MDLRDLALNWYAVLTTVNAAAAGPLMALSGSIGLPIVAALRMSLLGATSPCQATMNASTCAFVRGASRVNRTLECAAGIVLIPAGLNDTDVYVLRGSPWRR